MKKLLNNYDLRPIKNGFILVISPSEIYCFTTLLEVESFLKVFEDPWPSEGIVQHKDNSGFLIFKDACDYADGTFRGHVILDSSGLYPAGHCYNKWLKDDFKTFTGKLHL